MIHDNGFGADFREVLDRTRDGRPVRALVASRVYSTDAADLWSALTDAERLPRWFLPVSGKLELGGRYQIKGNAEGTILICKPPQELEVTWEFGGNVSWVRVSLNPDTSDTSDTSGTSDNSDNAGGSGASGTPATKMTLEHLMPMDQAAEDHWKQYGPGAGGVGWDLTFLGLDLHLQSGGEAIDQEQSHAWMASDAGKAFMRASAKQWGEAHVKAGEESAVAEAMAQRTADFYTGG